MPDEPTKGKFPEPPSDEEIERRLRKLLEDEGAAEEQKEEEVDEIELKLREMDEKISEARNRGMPEVPDWNYKRPETKKPEKTEYGGLAVGLSIAYTIIGVPLVFAALGYLLRSVTGNPIWVSVCVLSGMVLGVVMAVITLNRHQDKL